MRHLAAYMLAKLAGKAEPTEADCAAILKGADVEVDEAALKNVIEALKGKNYDELIAQGKEKMAKLPAAGAAPVAAAAPVEEKKEEKKVEEEPVIAGFAFGDSSSSDEETDS